MTSTGETIKATNGKLRNYEMVFIISPEVSEEAIETTVDKVSKFITGRGGVVSNIDRWGKKKLAYPIKHFLEGTYVLAKFQLEPAKSKELEANLKISEDILRHLVITLEK